MPTSCRERPARDSELAKRCSGSSATGPGSPPACRRPVGRPRAAGRGGWSRRRSVPGRRSGPGADSELSAASRSGPAKASPLRQRSPSESLQGSAAGSSIPDASLVVDARENWEEVDRLELLAARLPAADPPDHPIERPREPKELREDRRLAPDSDLCESLSDRDGDRLADCGPCLGPSVRPCPCRGPCPWHPRDRPSVDRPRLQFGQRPSAPAASGAGEVEGPLARPGHPVTTGPQAACRPHACASAASLTPSATRPRCGGRGG